MVTIVREGIMNIFHDHDGWVRCKLITGKTEVVEKFCMEFNHLCTYMSEPKYYHSIGKIGDCEGKIKFNELGFEERLKNSDICEFEDDEEKIPDTKSLKDTVPEI